MANSRNNYMYETSPRKLKPEYIPPKEERKKKNPNLKSKPKNKTKVDTRKKKTKSVMYLIIAFAVLFAMGFQNSKINEQFSELKSSEKKLATIQKENEQLRVSIENTLNLSNLEQMAREQIGMQKASAEQTRYVKLPKKDYVEVASEQIVRNENGIFQTIFEFIKNLYK